jgi:hypothetical protein
MEVVAQCVMGGGLGRDDGESATAFISQTYSKFELTIFFLLIKGFLLCRFLGNRSRVETALPYRTRARDDDSSGSSAGADYSSADPDTGFPTATRVRSLKR